MQRSEQAAAENLWMEFLNLRQKVIQQFHREGKDFNEIARVISLTGSQTKIIFQTQKDIKELEPKEVQALDAQRYRKAVAHGVIVLHNGAKACVGKVEADAALDAIAPLPTKEGGKQEK